MHAGMKRENPMGQENKRPSDGECLMYMPFPPSGYIVQSSPRCPVGVVAGMMFIEDRIGDEARACLACVLSASGSGHSAA